MFRTVCGLLALLLFQQRLVAQEKKATDSATLLQEVIITAFGQNTTDRHVSNIVKIIQSNNADRYNKTSLVNGFNSLAGVRMEERSPGSYRINIRGSSLRSPFGVHNVKVYWNDIPVTDPGGNTYFNEFAFNNFSYIEVFKGPAGSMYGAGTAGLLLMHSFGSNWTPSLHAEYLGGSYGLHNILGDIAFGNTNNRHLLTYNHVESDGYRNHTRTIKDNASYVAQLKISDKEMLTASVLYTNLFYQTPGGLTQSEYRANPRQSQPKTGVLPSADAAKAAIYQKTFIAGISHQYHFTNNFANTTTLYGSFAHIQNPTFRNYKRRIEPSFGGRTSFGYTKNLDAAKLQLTAGSELQQGFFNTQVSNNKNGNPDILQTNDDIRYTTYSLFAQADISFNSNWIITAGASINRSTVRFTRLSQYPVQQQDRTYRNEWSPRLSIKKNIDDKSVIFASIARGFSPPTISELLPSTGVISTFLEAEEGTSYETGGRTALLNGKLQVELTGFYFKLNHALVSRRDSSGADYYVNAGSTRQEGVELSADYQKFFYQSFFDYLTIKTAWAFSDFRYGDFQKDSVNFSGKRLPGVSRNTLALLTDLQTKMGLYLNLSYYYGSKLFLNDANSAATNPYHLPGARLGWQFPVKKSSVINCYAGIDNLLDETYSLGNDINAAGGRYYNAAPARNYYFGLSYRFNTAAKHGNTHN
jgi:iron complex outermembrane receptor protein